LASLSVNPSLVINPFVHVSATAAEDDKVVGVGDNMSTEGFATSASTPVLQEPVHVDVGKQWARDALNAKDNFQFERKIGRC